MKAGDHELQVVWAGLGDEEPTWEPVEVIFKDAQKVVVWMLKQDVPLQVWRTSIALWLGDVKNAARNEVNSVTINNTLIYASVLDGLESV